MDENSEAGSSSLDSPLPGEMLVDEYSVDEYSVDEYSADGFERNRPRCFDGFKLILASVIGLALVVAAAVLAATITSMKSTDVETTGEFSKVGSREILNSGCTTIEDIKELTLQILFQVSDPDKLFDAAEISALETSIAEGYNAATLGCDGDDFNRFMYQCFLVHNSLIRKYYVTEETNLTSIDAWFDCKISCNGCTDVNAFASVYASAEVGNKKPQKEEDEEHLLRAGDIMAEIDSQIARAVPVARIFSVSIAMYDDGVSSIEKSMTRSEWETHQDKELNDDTGNTTTASSASVQSSASQPLPAENGK